MKQAIQLVVESLGRWGWNWERKVRKHLMLSPNTWELFSPSLYALITSIDVRTSVG